MGDTAKQIKLRSFCGYKPGEFKVSLKTCTECAMEFSDQSPSVDPNKCFICIDANATERYCQARKLLNQWIDIRNISSPEKIDQVVPLYVDRYVETNVTANMSEKMVAPLSVIDDTWINNETWILSNPNLVNDSVGSCICAICNTQRSLSICLTCHLQKKSLIHSTSILQCAIIAEYVNYIKPLGVMPLIIVPNPKPSFNFFSNLKK
jgi:hypothetical protein